MLEVDVDETKTVGGAQVLTVRGTTTQTHVETRTVVVQQDESLTVTGELTNRSDNGPLVIEQGANNRLEMSNGANIEMGTDGSIVLRVGETRLELHPDRVELRAAQLLLVGGELVRASVDANVLELGGGNATLLAETEARLEAGASFVANSGNATIEGGDIAINGSDIEAVATQIKLN